MQHEITTTKRVTEKVVFDLNDLPRIERWPGFSHRGKPVKLEVMSFLVATYDDEEPDIGRLKIGGWLVKQDGTISGVTWVEEELWGSWWEDRDSARYRSDVPKAFAHLVEAARPVALEVLAR